jgi:L-asparaginase II
MTNPVLVEILRGGIVESAHRGAVVVVDGDGRTVAAVGDVARPVFPRSAVKAIQALPLVESGAADAFGFANAELALACASHAGEPGHTELAASMLARAGLDDTALECGTHWPSSQEATIALARSGGTAGPLHNNCSGKHSGFLATCRHCGIDHRGYVGVGHRFQAMIAQTMSEFTGAAHDASNMGIDGCSIPTYAVPLENLALGFARMTSGNGLAPQRAAAAKRLMEACMAEPFYVSGTGGACTRLMQAAPGRIFAKIGAEGVYCASLPELGLGIALKCDDGASRAAEALVASVMGRLLSDEALAAKLDAIGSPELTNRRGLAVGKVRVTGALAVL